jgi:excisionase family DNA binding protein
MTKVPQTAYCTTREAADLLGISLRTAQLWAESGQLEAWKTEGGHRRITRSSVQRLIDGDGTPRKPNHNGQPSASRALSNIKVLIVEDDSVLLKLYKAAIASWSLPAETITAQNGVEGLIRVGRDAPDLMITDLSMPGMDGFQLINNLADSAFREGMEIVVVTGMDKTSIEERGGLPHGIRILPKPVPFVVLHEIFAEMLERRSAYL